MVRAIIDGIKTQTRRVVALPRWAKGRDVECNHDGKATCFDPQAETHTLIRCPFAEIDLGGPRCSFRYVPGTRLWVRETWRVASVNHRMERAQFYTIQFRDFAVLPHPQPEQELFAPLVANDELAVGGTGIAFGKWRPSIFLRRWASRIVLEVTNVRVERLQEISESDAAAEGVGRIELAPGPKMGIIGGVQQYGHPMTSTHEHAFRVLWDKLNAARGFGWNANPWVWVVEFRRV